MPSKLDTCQISRKVQVIVHLSLPEPLTIRWDGQSYRPIYYTRVYPQVTNGSWFEGLNSNGNHESYLAYKFSNSIQKENI